MFKSHNRLRFLFLAFVPGPGFLAASRILKSMSLKKIGTKKSQLPFLPFFFFFKCCVLRAPHTHTHKHTHTHTHQYNTRTHTNINITHAHTCVSHTDTHQHNTDTYTHQHKTHTHTHQPSVQEHTHTQNTYLIGVPLPYFRL